MFYLRAIDVFLYYSSAVLTANFPLKTCFVISLIGYQGRQTTKRNLLLWKSEAGLYTRRKTELSHFGLITLEINFLSLLQSDIGFVAEDQGYARSMNQNP